MSSIKLLSVATYLPARKANVRALVAESGGDAAQYSGWSSIQFAADSEHPSTMAASALNAALRKIDLDPKRLGLIIYTGSSKDYLAPWTASSEVMRLLDLGADCLCFDMNVGCMGSVTSLEFASAWLQSRGGGGYAAILSAEKWAHTVERSDPLQRALCGYADGAGAMIIGGGEGKALATFRGARFRTNVNLNDVVLVEFGGTRAPTPPSGQSSYRRRLRAIKPQELMQAYKIGIEGAFKELSTLGGAAYDRLVCNQVSPNLVKMMGELARVPADRVMITGHDHGHIGNGDVMLGLERTLDATRPGERIAVLGSSTFGWGVALLDA